MKFPVLLAEFKPVIRQSLRTAFWLVSIMVPVSLGVSILDYTGILQQIAGVLDPAFSLLGVRGEGALVFITGIFLNVYSAIAVMTSLSFDVREMTILAMMSLISHNLITELLILKKTGSNPWRMLILRLSMSVLGAVMLNFLLPGSAHPYAALNGLNPSQEAFLPFLQAWAIRAFLLSIKVVAFLTGLMILQKIFEMIGLIRHLSRGLSPFLYLMGLPSSTAFLWIVANLLGLGYGAAIMLDWAEKGKISVRDNDLLNHHIAVCHSLFEDTLLFMAIGVSGFWISVPRLMLAIVIVWVVRVFRLQRIAN